MAENLSIAEAEAAYADETAQWQAQKDRISLRMRVASAILLTAAAVGIFLMFVASLFFALLVMPALLVGILLFLFSGDLIDYELKHRIERLRAAQRSWVESHGLELPSGAFAELSFPTSISESPTQTYGVAQVIDTATGRLISVALRSTPEEGYRLFGTEGEILKPVLATA